MESVSIGSSGSIYVVSFRWIHADLIHTLSIPLASSYAEDRDFVEYNYPLGHYQVHYLESRKELNL